MIDVRSRVKGLTDRGKWAAGGAAFMAKARATKAVWFPPKPDQAGKKVASTAKKAAKKPARSAKKTAKKSTGTGKKAAKKATGAARKKKTGR